MEIFVDNLRKKLQNVRESFLTQYSGQYIVQGRRRYYTQKYLITDYELPLLFALAATLKQGEVDLDELKLYLNVGQFVVPTLTDVEGEDVEDAFSKVMIYLENFVF